MKFLRFVALLIAAPLAASAMSNSVVNMSHYDLMRVNFDLMREQGIVGAIHEATYPPYVRDDKYFRRQVDATRAGLLWGAYHFANARDPVRQADFFLDTVASAWRRADPGGRPNQVLLVLDFEKNGHYPGGTMTVEQAVAFVERVRQRTGKLPGLYSNEHRIQSVLNSPRVSPAYKRILASCWLWVANYGAVPRDMSPWRRWHMWQYTGDGKCRLRPAASYPRNIANIKNAERNMFYADRGALRTFWQQHGWRVSELSSSGQSRCALGPEPKTADVRPCVRSSAGDRLWRDGQNDNSVISLSVEGGSRGCGARNCLARISAGKPLRPG